MAEPLQPDNLVKSQTRTLRHWLVAGVVVVAAALVWIVVDRQREQPWNGQAVTARFVDMTVARGETDVHLVLSYALTNQTGHTYRMPKPAYGELMRRLPDGTMKEVDSVEWDQSTTVPSPGMAEVQFDVALDPLQYLSLIHI